MGALAQVYRGVVLDVPANRLGLPVCCDAGFSGYKKVVQECGVGCRCELVENKS